MILSICDNPDILKIMNLIILIINIIKVAVPIILILTLMIRFTSSVAKSKEDALESIKKSAPANIIAAVLIFLVPTFVSIVTKISFPNSDFVKCLSGASNETIAASYVEKAEKLVAKAELSLKINDYTAAMNYLKNLSNSEKKEELAKRLEAIREKLNDKPSTPTESGKYSKVNYSNFKWVYYEAGTGPIKDYYSGGIPYAIRAPENVSDLNGVSLPLIIFFHGAGEEKKKISGNIFIKDGVFQKLITSWNNYGLQTIPAIMISPHAYGSFDYLDTNFETISALIEYAKDKYNIDMDRIVLMGHSMGADDTVSVPYKFHTKYNKDYFSAYVMFSASTKLSMSPYNSSNDIKEYFTGKKIKGYSENNLCEGFFNLVNVPLTIYPGAGHSKVPEKALTEDLNNDGVSDIMYWLFGEDAKVKNTSSSMPNGDEDDVTPGKFIADPGTTSSCNKNGKYKWCAPSRGVFGSFAYYDSKPESTEDRWSLEMDPKWAKENFVTIKKTCSNGWELNFQMHRLAKSTWEKVQDKLCEITTTGIDGYKYDPSEFRFSGAKASTVARFVSGTKSVSNHSYGTTIDINPSVSYTVNGKKYVPYNRDVKAYENFVQALGREDDYRNINYILWKKIFQPLGFTWGGNWGRKGNKSTFDGMHFEIDWR